MHFERVGKTTKSSVRIGDCPLFHFAINCRPHTKKMYKNQVFPIIALHTVKAYQQKLVLANVDVSGSLPSHYSLQDILLCSVPALLGIFPLSRLPSHGSPETNVHRHD